LIHWLQWLAQNSPVATVSTKGYALWVEPEIRLAGTNVEFYCAPPLQRQAADLLAVWPKIWSDFAAHLGVSSPLEFADDATSGRISSSDKLQVYLRAAKGGGISGGAKISVSSLGERWQMIGVLGHEVGHKLLGGCNTSISEAFVEWLASRAIRAAGHPKEAREKIDRHLADFRAADPGGTKLDIADPLTAIKQSRACQGKWIWILSQLCDKHGETLVRDYLAALRKNVILVGPIQKLEGTQRVRLTMRDHVNALSKAAGEDLSPWFRQMGISGL
jgi:hypothetical protein